jgi:hypothetical protein
MATIQKRYEYKISRGGIYIGLLPNVKSEFTYHQNLFSAGAQLSIKVATSPDTASLPVNPILDETGAIITDEDGGSILEERSPDLVGDAADNILIRNDNDVEVWEYSKYNPNGIIVFKGYIAKWKANFGGEEDVEITILSHGQDLAHYLTPGGTADTLDQSQTQSDGLSGGDISTFSSMMYGQTFVVGAGVTNISKIILKLSVDPLGSSQTTTLKLWSSVSSANTGGTPLGIVSVTHTGYDTLVSFVFASPVTVTAGATYFFTLHPDNIVNTSSTSFLTFADKSTGDVYANGSLYRSLSGAAYSNATYSTYDIYFQTYSTVNSTTKTYTSSDPSTTLAAIIDYYVSAGGDISKPAAGYTLTGVTPASTVFKVNTILEAIQQIVSLAPYDWYWYVDPATKTLYFKQTATTADHRLIKGRHIEMLEIEPTKEDIINVVYFSGGPTAGVNLFVNVNSSSSLLTNRRGMARLSNNRVTDTTVGQLIAANHIASHSAQKYITTVTVTEAAYDISLFDLGEIVSFEGFGTFADSLLLQIVGLTRNADDVVLDLGLLLPRTTELTSQLRQELADIQTIDNPTIPS